MTNIANNTPLVALPDEPRSIEWYRERIDYLATFMTEVRELPA